MEEETREEGKRDRNKQSRGRKHATGKMTGENNLCSTRSGKHTHEQDECFGIPLKLLPDTLFCLDY